MLVRTSVTGKYTHMGTSTMSFGRDDDFNEHGLAVTMSACGFPVGAVPFLRAPKVKGLHFWAAIRALRRIHSHWYTAHASPNVPLYLGNVVP